MQDSDKPNFVNKIMQGVRNIYVYFDLFIEHAKQELVDSPNILKHEFVNSMSAKIFEIVRNCFSGASFMHQNVL